MRVHAASALPAEHLRPLWLALGAWRRIPARYVAIAVALGLAWGLANTFGWWLGSGTTNVARTMVHFVYEAVLPMLFLLLAITVADARTGSDASRALPYAVAAIMAVVAGELVFVATVPLLGLSGCSCTMDAWPAASRAANMLPDSLLICGFVTAGYCYRRQAAARMSRLHAVQLERAQLTRRALESRLQAMQACIEPQFLFDTLSDIERLHATDANSADRMLTELIVYLRAALPHLKETTSTVGKECELAYAYLNIRKLRNPECLSFAFEVDADAQDASMPPMLLLPLIDHVVQDGRRPAAEYVLRIGIHVVHGRLRLALNADAMAFGPGGQGHAVVAGIRDRLHTLYGGAARLEVSSDDRRQSTITLEIPHEPAGPFQGRIPERAA